MLSAAYHATHCRHSCNDPQTLRTATSPSASKDDPDNPRVLSYPSKSAAMFVPESLIFRSDSNGEDLDGYAGAGLYDSITMDPCVVRYPKSKLRLCFLCCATDVCCVSDIIHVLTPANAKPH